MARPQKYQREKVIDAAQALFWQKGYQATSVVDLQSATELKPGSLYKAFGNKDGLLQAVLENYSNNTLLFIDSLTEKHSSVMAVLEVFLNRQIDRSCEKDAEGCLLVNSLLELQGYKPQLETEVKQQLLRVQVRFAQLIEQGIKSGELSDKMDASGKATAIMTVVWGLSVMSRMSPNKTHLQTFCDDFLATMSS
ncbi:TetR/AcrR family transcriptional regulator [Endozoicomonas sp. OPT23]|uniref:TetR/AcrR family transcriptional regulator n=1 Tax=Endozoicomonas sp. OPT23 TaxID=2072845 RepID=UPI0018916F7A|nr:TetR/AcrR family transcriptional regulator [Endozoicomonas sp. OPT23]